MIDDCYLLNHIFSFVPHDVYAIKETSKGWLEASFRMPLLTSNIPVTEEYIGWARSHPDFEYSLRHLERAPKELRPTMISDGCPFNERMLRQALRDKDIVTLDAMSPFTIFVGHETCLMAIETGDFMMCRYVSRIGYFWRYEDADGDDVPDYYSQCIKAAINTKSIPILKWTVSMYDGEFLAEEWCVEALHTRNREMIEFVVFEAIYNLRNAYWYLLNIWQCMDEQADEEMRNIFKPLFSSVVLHKLKE